MSANPQNLARAAAVALMLAPAFAAPALAGGGPVFGGFYGVRILPDRADPNAGVVAGSPGSLDALARGIRCEYRYVVRNGERHRFRHCG